MGKFCILKPFLLLLIIISISQRARCQTKFDVLPFDSLSSIIQKGTASIESHLLATGWSIYRTYQDTSWNLDTDGGGIALIVEITEYGFDIGSNSNSNLSDGIIHENRFVSAKAKYWFEIQRTIFRDWDSKDYQPEYRLYTRDESYVRKTAANLEAKGYKLFHTGYGDCQQAKIYRRTIHEDEYRDIIIDKRTCDDYVKGIYFIFY